MTELERYEGGQIVTRHDLRNAATDSWTDVLEQVGDLAHRIAGTDFVPASFRDSVPAVAATILTGRELGFAPMTALASLHSIKGRVGLSAEAMRALVLQAGHEIVTTTSTSQQCTMKGRRVGASDWTEVTWTLADARAAGLLNGSGWKNYPRQMLQARASSELCRLAFPDVIRGLASLEEITEYDVIPGPAAAPAEDGEATKQAPVKRAARKRAPAPKAEPADPPALPDEAPAPAAPEVQNAEPPAPDLPETTSPPVEPSGADVDQDGGPVDAHAGEESGEAPTGGEVLGEEIVDAEVVEDEFNVPINQGQRALLMSHFGRLGITERAERLRITCQLIGRQVESANELTFKEATALLHVLERSKDAEALADTVQIATDWSGE